eukprot:scaffold447_cov307-Pinguiococcus_pyrenoidosus.AAC.91
MVQSELCLDRFRIEGTNKGIGNCDDDWVGHQDWFVRIEVCGIIQYTYRGDQACRPRPRRFGVPEKVERGDGICGNVKSGCAKRRLHATTTAKKQSNIRFAIVSFDEPPLLDCASSFFLSTCR